MSARALKKIERKQRSKLIANSTMMCAEYRLSEIKTRLDKDNVNRWECRHRRRTHDDIERIEISGCLFKHDVWMPKCAARPF